MGFIGSVWKAYNVRKLREKARKMLADPVIAAFIQQAVVNALTFDVTKDETFQDKVKMKRDEVERGVW